MSRGVRGSARCGTTSGYAAHIRRRETPCAACRRAQADDQRRLTATNPRVRASKLRYARAYNQALAELRQRHIDEFTDLLNTNLQRQGVAA